MTDLIKTTGAKVVRLDTLLPNQVNAVTNDSANPSITTEGKKHKGMLPASGKLQKINPPEQALKEKINGILNELQTNVEKANPDPQVKNILMLYIAFARSQMDQNDKLEAGWMDQQQVQNQLLEDSAKEQKKIANESTTGQHLSLWKAILVGIAVIAVCAIVGFFTAGIGVGIAAGIAIAAVGVGAPAGVASSNPNASGVGGLTDTGPDQNKLTQIGILNSFWNLIAQQANQRIQTGTQVNLVQASSNNTQQGQQAAQIIQEWGQMTRFQVAR